MQRQKQYRLLAAAMLMVLAGGLAWAAIEDTVPAKPIPMDTPRGDGFVGTSSCRACHEKFYKLWAPSHHGLAMQPYTDAFAAAELTVHPGPIQVGAYAYQAWVGPGQGFVKEVGPDGEKQYKIEHVLGGKNVYYFLAPWQRGRLQTLPVAYNVHTRSWYDTAASGVRHFHEGERDQAVHWTDPLYTFNTSCYDCHVSQLATNYNPADDSYRTVWAEAGINCETCHGPSEEHVRKFTADPNHDPNDLGLISTRVFNDEQLNSMCNTCHAKMSPITASFMPGERFFDHFNLITLENPDFYPDGRDLGENYTMTTWRMSECVKAGKLNCMHCHTSSGRYRFKERKDALGSCLPCHQTQADNIEKHSGHKQTEESPVCISCHMPMTAFAHMNRSDHSMRPPTPGVSKEFKSDIACLLCHKEEGQDADWADRTVREWKEVDYQQPFLERARLLDQARRGDWKNLKKILTYVRSRQRDEILTTSLIRAMVGCSDDSKWPVLIAVLENDRSPLVRAAAADALDNYFSGPAVKALIAATQDSYRLVRVGAAASLASLPRENLPAEARQQVDAATEELKGSFTSRQDDFAAHFNRGNFYMDRRDYDTAIEALGTASKLRPDFLAARVNIAFAYNAQGKNDQAEAAFRKALELDPNSAIIYMNFGMLLGEMGRPDEAKDAFLRSYRLDPNNPQPAYNLGVILAETDPDASLAWVKQAYDLRPQDDKFGFTYAFYLARRGRVDEAIPILNRQIDAKVAGIDAYMLLVEIYQSQGRIDQVKGVFERALQNLELSSQDRDYLQAQIQRIP